MPLFFATMKIMAIMAFFNLVVRSRGLISSLGISPLGSMLVFTPKICQVYDSYCISSYSEFESARYSSAHRRPTLTKQEELANELELERLGDKVKAEFDKEVYIFCPFICLCAFLN
jgi:hypothetical protein